MFTMDMPLVSSHAPQKHPPFGMSGNGLVRRRACKASVDVFLDEVSHDFVPGEESEAFAGGGRLVNSYRVHGGWRSAAEVVRLGSDQRPGPHSGQRIIATAAPVILRLASRRIAIFLALRRRNLLFR